MQIESWIACVRAMCSATNEAEFADEERSLYENALFEIQCARSKSVCTWALANVKQINVVPNGRAMRMMCDLIEMGADVQNGLLHTAFTSANTPRPFENSETFYQALRLICLTMHAYTREEWKATYEPLIKRGFNSYDARQMTAALRLWARGPFNDLPLIASQHARKRKMRNAEFFDAFMECAPPQWIDECVHVLEMDVTRAYWCECVHARLAYVKPIHFDTLQRAAVHHASAMPCLISSPDFVDDFLLLRRDH